MRAKVWIDRIRFNYRVSLLLTVLLTPVRRAAIALARQVARKVWVNGRTVSYGSCRISFPRNVGVQYSTALYWHGTEGFEAHTSRVLRSLFPRAEHFLDVGSNVGFYAVLAKKVNPALTVDAFEPVPSIHGANLLFHTVNGLDSSRVWRKALGGSVGRATLYQPTQSTAILEESASTLREDSWQSRRQERQEIPVEVETMDTFLARVGIAGRLLIKIDVEDFESQVLAGATETLKTRRPVIVCEILPREHGNRETWSVIDGHGYVPFAITPTGCFRIGQEDLVGGRSFLDVLLVPGEAAPPGRNYLTDDDLPALLGAGRSQG
jgi:FkbM family methyltransferase